MSDSRCLVESRLLQAAHTQPFRTVEEIRAQVDETEEPYLRREDPLCRGFLDLADCAANDASIRTLFPFIREASLFGLPPRTTVLCNWMTTAFFAGFELGRSRPDQAETALPEHEVLHTLRRLRLIEPLLEGHPPTARALMRAFEAIRRRQWSGLGDDRAVELLLNVLPKTLRCGIAAATVARFDPSLTEWVDRITPEYAEPRMELYVRLWNRVLVSAADEPRHQLLRHPLLRMAEILYPEEPLCRTMLQGFLHRALRELEVRSETACLGSDGELTGWVERAVAFGEALIEERPGIAHDAFGELSLKGRMGEKAGIGVFRQRAGKGSPPELTQSLVDFYGSTHGYTTPEFYAQTVNRVLRCVDWALWMPLDRVAVRRLSSRGDRYLAPGESEEVDERHVIYVDPPGTTGPLGDEPLPPPIEDDGRFRVVLGIDDPNYVLIFAHKIRHALQGARELVVEHLIHGEDILALTTARRIHLGLVMIHHLTWRGAPNKGFAQRLYVCACVVKQLRRVARAPVLVLSGLDSSEARAQMLEAGATDYILLPGDLPRFMEHVNALTRH